MVSTPDHTHDAPEIEEPIAEEFLPRIEPGEYDAVCLKTEIGRSWGGRRDIYLRFRIYDSEYEGTELFMKCSYPKTKDKKMSYRHKYYQQWMLANGGPPAKKQRMSPKMFLNRMFKIKVVDTKRTHNDGTPLPSFAQYSVISTIIEVVAGGPPE